MIKLSLSGLLIAALACASAASVEKADSKQAAAESASAQQVTAYYPLAVGNEWTYEFSSGEQRKRDTIKIVEKRGAWFYDDHKGRLRFDETGLRDADRYLLRPPLKTGQSWTSVDEMIVHRFQITDADASEVTPAGTFLHCVKVKNEEPLPDGRGSFVTEWSFAPDVGMVRLRTAVARADGKTVPQLSGALVEYRLQK